MPILKNGCQMVKNAPNLTFLVSKWKRMNQGIGRSAVAQPQHARFPSGQHGIDPHSGPGFLERARASSESWVVCDTRYPSMEASLS